MLPRDRRGADPNLRNPLVDERLGCPDSLTLFENNRPSLVSNDDTGRCLRPLGVEEFQLRDDQIGLEEDPQNVLWNGAESAFGREEPIPEAQDVDLRRLVRLEYPANLRHDGGEDGLLLVVQEEHVVDAS